MTDLFIVDAFTARPFRGNPAAVCLPSTPHDEAWMQDVASEMNLSETAFVVARSDGGFDLRWFTPTIEVALCGHATVASAHVLWESGRLDPERPARFHTRSGEVGARRTDDWTELDFPALGLAPAEPPADVRSVVPATPRAVMRGAKDALGEVVWVFEVDSPAAVRDLEPHLEPIANDPETRVVVTAEDDGEYDFVSRYFAPGAGIDEDPVTGSSFCFLGPFWAERLGRRRLTAHQVSRRGGVARLDVGAERVGIAGQATIVLSGRLHV